MSKGGVLCNVRGGSVKEKNNSHKNGIKNTGVIVILASCLIMLMFLFIDSCINFNNKIYTTFRDFVINISMAGITIGAGTVLYSYFDFVKYIEQKLKGIVLDYDFLDRLEVDKKEEILNRLEKQLLYKSLVSTENTLYDFANSEIKKLSKEPFYESMYLNVNCYVKDGFIYKKIIRKYTLNYSMIKTFTYDLEKLTKTWFTDDSDDDSYNISKLTINDVDFFEYIQKESGIDKTKDTKYNKYIFYHFDESVDSIYKNIYNEEETLNVEVEYTTKVNVLDLTMSYRVYSPCKKFDVVFTYDKNMLDVFCEVFSFKDRIPNEQSICKDRIKLVTNDNCINVSFKDWILPGDGIIFVFALKNH